MNGDQHAELPRGAAPGSAETGEVTRGQFLKYAAASGAVLGIPGVLAACGEDENVPSGPAATMRIALPYGPIASLDPHLAGVGLEARVRNWNVFQSLFEFDPAGKLVPVLAEEATPNADATEWTLLLRSGVTFHDGSPFSADDVVYSLRRILDPATKAEALNQLIMVDGKGIQKVDARTVRIPLKYAFSLLPEQLATLGTVTMVKAGEREFAEAIGTGPFVYDGGNAQKYTLRRNRDYWRSGRPRLNVVEVIKIQDATARLNAIKTGEVDAIHPVEAAQVAAAQGDSKLTVFNNKSGSFMPMYMNASKPPFSDNRAREALKFAADRERMNQLAYGGKGQIGNDMFGNSDPGYPKDLEQRPYDPERAKALWKQAGMAGKQIEFWASDAWPGHSTHGTAFAQQAKPAGIDVRARRIPVDQFMTKVYAIKPFANDYWYATPLWGVVSLAFVPDGAYFSTASWATPSTTKMYEEAIVTTDENLRNELARELLTVFRDEGPYIVWAFEAGSDVYSARIGGQRNHMTRGLNGFRLDEFFVKS